MATAGLVPVFLSRVLGWRVAAWLVLTAPVVLTGAELLGDVPGYGIHKYETVIEPILERAFPELDFPDKISQL